MKQYVFGFLKRGLMAAAGGPVVLAIVCGILGATGVITTLTPGQVCMGILTVSLMAFIAAGINVVYEIEQLPLFTAILLHGAALYVDYILVYLLNGWLKSELTSVLVFTGVFILGYALIWLIIYTVTKKSADRLNRKMRAG